MSIEEGLEKGKMLKIIIKTIKELKNVKIILIKGTKIVISTLIFSSKIKFIEKKSKPGVNMR